MVMKPTISERLKPMTDAELHAIDVFVGNRIRARRKILGISLEQLAMKLGLTYQQLQKYEKAVNRISGDKLCILSRVLNMPIVDFFPPPTYRGEHKQSSIDKRSRAELEKDPALWAKGRPHEIEADLVSRTLAKLRDPVRTSVRNMIKTIAAAYPEI